MASLQEVPVWVEEIYRIQAHIDSPVGGAGGLTNIQPGQIANRTMWLFSRMMREHSLGGHLLSAEQIAEAANIDGSKTTLNVPFTELRALLDTGNEELQRLINLAEDTIGSDGLKFEAITRAQRFLWDKGFYHFGWEFFTSGLRMRQFEERPILSTVHVDDTVILEDVTGILKGDMLVVYSAGGTDAEIIRVGNILHDSSTGQYRILASEGLAVDRSSGFIGSMSWSIDSETNTATAPVGSVYLSEDIPSLLNASSGMLVIRLLEGSGSVRVERSFDDGITWVEVVNTGVEDYGSDGYNALYELEPGNCRLKITTIEGSPAKIGFMAVIPRIGVRTVAPIRKPVVLAPAEGDALTVPEMYLKSSVFRRAYGDNLVKTEFSISKMPSTPTNSTPVFTLYFDQEEDNPLESPKVSVVERDENENIIVVTSGDDDEGGEIIYAEAGTPGNDLMEMLDATTGEGTDMQRVFPYGTYFIRCRHTSDVGDVSEWSDPVMFSLMDSVRTFGFDGSNGTLRIGGFDAEAVEGTVGIGGDTFTVAQDNKVSGLFSSLSDSSIARFGFAGVEDALGFDEGMFITE